MISPSDSYSSRSFDSYLRATAIAALMVVVFSSACSRAEKENDPHASRLARAQQLVDENRPDEAIALIQLALEEISEKSTTVHSPESTTNPASKTVLSPKSSTLTLQEERYRAVLASAHLMKADLPAHKFYRFARTFSESDSLGDESFSFFSFGGTKTNRNPQTAVEIFEAHGLKALAIFLQVKARYEAIPEIDEAQDHELSLALEALAPIRNPSSGVALYRSLIKTVRFKRLLQNDFLRIAAPSVSRGECRIGKMEFFGALQRVLDDATDIAHDLKFSFPERESEISNALNSLSTAAVKLSELRTKVIGETGAESDAFAASELIRFVRLHLGWEWICE